VSALAPLLFGAAFGVALERAELTRKERVVGVFRFTDLTMLKFLLSGLASGAFVVQGALALGLVASVPAPPSLPLANLVGGVLFGVAMAGAGFCSGTIFAAAGSGRVGVLAGALGLLAGALVMEAGGGAWAARLRAVGPRADVTIAGLVGVNAWLILLALMAVIAFVVYVIERRQPAPPRLAPPPETRAGSVFPRRASSRG
jgi:uncharacterized protein